MSLPIYSNLIVKTDAANLAQVQGELRKTFSNNALTFDISRPANLQELNKALAITRREATGLVGDFQKLGAQTDNVFRRFSSYFIASTGLLGGIALIKTAISEGIKFQDELIKLKQVSGDADNVIKKLGDDVGNLAKAYGVSSAELIKSATVLRQAGLSTKETGQALQALAKTDLAPNFESIAKTTEGVIAIFQQFGKDAGSLEKQLGALNAVAGEYAVESSDLITAVQKTGGAAKAAGADLNQLAALFTSVRATTRESADAISTGLRTIFGRLQRPDTLKFLDDLGIKLRYTAEEAQKLGQADIAGKFVGPFEAIQRIAKGTSNLGTGSTLFSNIVEEIGGLRQLSRVIPLLRETTLQAQAMNTALAGEDSLDIQALQKKDSYLNQLVRIKEEFLAIGRVLVESEGFNKFISFLETSAKAAIRLLDAIGPLIPLLGLIAGSNILTGALATFTKRTFANFGGNLNEPPPPRKGFAAGGIIAGPSNGDRIPALLEGGEAVIPAESVKKYSHIIPGLISGKLPGFASGFNPLGYKPFELMSDIDNEARLRRLIKEENIKARREAKAPYNSDSSYGFLPQESILSSVSRATQLSKDAGLFSDVQSVERPRGASGRYVKIPDFAPDYQSPQLSQYRQRILGPQSTESLSLGQFSTTQATSKAHIEKLKQLRTESEKNELQAEIVRLETAKRQAEAAKKAGVLPISNLANEFLLNPNINNQKLEALKDQQKQLFPPTASIVSYSQQQYNPDRLRLRIGDQEFTNRVNDLLEGASSKSRFVRNIVNENKDYLASSTPEEQQAFILQKRRERADTYLARREGRQQLVNSFAGGNDYTLTEDKINYVDPKGQSVSNQQSGAVNSILNRGRFFNAAASFAGVAAPLALGYAATQSYDKDSQGKLGGASIGASIGAALGSATPLGPYGTLIGAAIGGIVGWFQGAAQAAEDLKKTTIREKLDDSIKHLNESLEAFATGSGSISDIAKELDNAKKGALAQAILDTKNGGDLIKANSDEFKKSVGLKLGDLSKVLQEEIKKQAKNGQPLDITSGDLGAITKNIQTLRPKANIKEEATRLYEAAKTDEISRQAQLRFTVEVNKSISSATSFSEAINKAAQEVKELDEKLKVITSGGYVGASFRPGEFGNIDKEDLSRLGGLSGGAFREVTNKIANVDQISKYLPEVLSRTIKPGNQASDNLSGDFVSTFNKIGQETGQQFDKKVINIMADKLQGLKSSELFENFKKDPEKFAKEFEQQFEPMLKAAQSIGKNLEERDRAYQDGLRHLLEISSRLNNLAEQKSALSTQFQTSQRDFNLENAGINPGRVVDPSIIFRNFNKIQDRLLGKAGIGENANAIGAVISELKDEEKVLREKAKVEADGVKGVTTFRDALFENQRKLADANRALERLTNTSDRLSILQQALANQRSERDAKLGFTGSLLTANPQEFLQKQIDARAAKIVIDNKASDVTTSFNKLGLSNGIPGLGNAIFKQGADFLKSLPEDLKIPSRFSKTIDGKRQDLSGPEIYKELIAEFSKNILKGSPLDVSGNEKNIKGIQDKIGDILKQAGAEGAVNGVNNAGGAVGIIATNLTKTAEDFKQTLVDNNKEFFNKIDKYVDALQQKATDTEKAVKNIQLAGLEEKEKGAKGLIGVDVDAAKKQISKIEASRKAQTELKQANSIADSQSQDIESYVEENKNKLSSQQLALNLKDKFGLDDKTTNSVLFALKKSVQDDPLNEFKRNEAKKKDRSVFDKLGLADYTTGIAPTIGTEEDKFLSGESAYRVDPKQISALIKRGRVSGPQADLVSANKGLDPRFKNLSKESLDLLKNGGNPELILAEVAELREKIRILEGGLPEQRRVLPKKELNIFGGLSLPAPEGNPTQPGGIQPKPGGRPVPEPQIDLLASFNRASEVFSAFNTNFAKQVEALAAIPRIIDMNINQKVEVIINGADVLNSLEPSMRTIANGAVSRAIEVIGGQLRESNITIKYDPNINPNANKVASDRQDSQGRVT